MRSMAYIVTVKEATPIEGKDRIQYIHFNENGYGVIADKSFNVGDKAVYMEVDSILPVKPEYEFLRKRCYKENLNGFLIKNMKMNGLYSNGIVFPMSIAKKNYKPNTDVTEELEIRKYEPENDASPKFVRHPVRDFLMKHKATRWFARAFLFKNKAKDVFPIQYIDKSDETNIQNEKGRFDEWKNMFCYVTRKMEGQSVTMIMLPKGKKYETKIFSRNSVGNDEHCAFSKKIGLEQKFKELWNSTHTRYAFQGEFCSPSVQKGIYKNGTHFYVYTVKDIDKGVLLDSEEIISICMRLGFERVPCVPRMYKKKLGDIFKSIADMQEYAEHQWFKVGLEDYVHPDIVNNNDDRDGLHYSKPDYHRWEGIVVRGCNNEFSFKVKSNEYALDGL